MEVAQLQRRYIQFNTSLFDEGYFDSQFQQLQQVQASGNPGFVAELASMYYRDADRILNELTLAVNQQTKDFKKMNSNAHQLKGSSASLGALRVRDTAIAFRRFCDEQNTEACMRTLSEIKQEYSVVKEKLHNLVTLEKQIVDAGGVIPVLP